MRYLGRVLCAGENHTSHAADRRERTNPYTDPKSDDLFCAPPIIHELLESLVPFNKNELIIHDGNITYLAELIFVELIHSNIPANGISTTPSLVA